MRAIHILASILSMGLGLWAQEARPIPAYLAAVKKLESWRMPDLYPGCFEIPHAPAYESKEGAEIRRCFRIFVRGGVHGSLPTSGPLIEFERDWSKGLKEIREIHHYRSTRTVIPIQAFLPLWLLQHPEGTPSEAMEHIPVIELRWDETEGNKDLPRFKELLDSLNEVVIPLVSKRYDLVYPVENGLSVVFQVWNLPHLAQEIEVPLGRCIAGGSGPRGLEQWLVGMDLRLYEAWKGAVERNGFRSLLEGMDLRILGSVLMKAAADHRWPALAQELVRRGIDFRHPTPEGDWTLLHVIELKDSALLEKVLSQHPPLNVVPRAGRTPLEEAVMGGSPQLAALLLAAGADPNVSSGTEAPLLEWAREKGDKDLETMLVKAGAKAASIAK
jgi:hypothetical protein